MFGPEAQSRLARALAIADLHVELRVVEEGVGVEVGRADRQPAVVDDADLRVDVELVHRRAGHRIDRRGEEPSATTIRIGQVGEHAAGVLLAVVGLGRQHDDDPQAVARRTAQLLGEHSDDLGRPEELGLQVHQLAGRAKRPHVGLQDPEGPIAKPVVDMLGNRAQQLDRRVSGAHRRRDRGQLLARHLRPAQIEVLGDVGDDRAAKFRAGIVPAEPPAGRMSRGVPAIAPLATARANSSRRRVGGSARSSAKCGATCQPAIRTERRAPRMASAIAASTSAPSMRTSIAQPSRGGGNSRDHGEP
jgi:hypothetical protein